MTQSSDLCLQRSLTDTSENHKRPIFVSVYGVHATGDSKPQCWRHYGSIWSWSPHAIHSAAIILENISPHISQSCRKALHWLKTHNSVIKGTSHSRFWVLRAAWGISCSAREPDSCSLECGDRRDGGGNEAFNPV